MTQSPERDGDDTVSASDTSPVATSTSSLAERLKPGVAIGRFFVVKPLGSGGMGVVFSAYDPALDRKVAIKLLRGERTFGAETRGRAQLVAEAQAMARLSHPNVIAVHEVAFHVGAAYLVMEYVAGPTLRSWLAASARSAREVLAMFASAGEGLVAAHREGIVHRDFKPDNVLVDRDGRARVGDFGLAAIVADDTRLTGSGGVNGTLPYMAPEQLRGEPCDARADQFAYCVALWEALHGTRPFAGTTPSTLGAAIAAGALREPVKKPPEWIRAAVLRGLAADPAARWPSMAALLAALRRDPRATRRRATAVAAAVALAGVALWAAWPSAVATDPCAGAPARLAHVWDAARQVEVHAAFAATGLPYAEDTWRAVHDRFDRYTTRWVDMSRDACRATRVEGRQSDHLMDLQMTCLEQRRRVLGDLSGLWARGVDGDALAHAADAAGGLAPLSECADVAALTDRAPPPRNPIQASLIAPARARLGALQAQVLAHRLTDAKQAVAGARTAAELAGWAPIEAEVAVLEGELLSVLGEAGAEPRLVAAHRLADASRDDRLRARALVSLVADLADHQQKVEPALRVADLAEGAVARLAPDDVMHGRLLRARGKALLTAGKYGDARRLLGDARAALVRALGPTDAETVATVVDLAKAANLAGDYAAARQLYDDMLAIALPILGGDHPQIAMLLTSQAAVLYDAGDLKACAEIYRRALAIDERVFGPDAAPTALTLNNLGRTEFGLHHPAEARRLFERALAIRERTLGPDHPFVATTLANLGIGLANDGQYEAAKANIERALAIKLKVYGPSHQSVALAYEQLAFVFDRQGDWARALEPYQRALELRRATLGPDHDQTVGSASQVGRILSHLHRCREAVPLLDRAIDALPKGDIGSSISVDAMLARARCDLEAGQPAQALARAERCLQAGIKLELDPPVIGSFDAMRWRALVALGRHDDAVAAARKAVQELGDDRENSSELTAVKAWLAAQPR